MSRITKAKKHTRRLQIEKGIKLSLHARKMMRHPQPISKQKLRELSLG